MWFPCPSTWYCINYINIIIIVLRVLFFITLQAGTDFMGQERPRNTAERVSNLNRALVPKNLQHDLHKGSDEERYILDWGCPCCLLHSINLTTPQEGNYGTFISLYAVLSTTTPQQKDALDNVTKYTKEEGGHTHVRLYIRPIHARIRMRGRWMNEWCRIAVAVGY